MSYQWPVDETRTDTWSIDQNSASTSPFLPEYDSEDDDLEDDESEEDEDNLDDVDQWSLAWDGSPIPAQHRPLLLSSSNFDRALSPTHPSGFSFASHFDFSPTSTAHVSAPRADLGNTSSAAATLQPTNPLQRRPTQPTASTRGLAAVAGHSDDWLDHSNRNAARQSNDFFAHAFETLSDSDQSANWDRISSASTNGSNMTPEARGGRPSESVVDLTAPSPPNRPKSTPKRPAEAAAAGGGSASNKRSKPSPSQHAEEIDLSFEDSAAAAVTEKLLQAQREAAIRAQQERDDAGGPLKLGQRQCIICMENYTNATTTACGHIYCHECLTQALMAGEKNNERGVGSCPVCRKPVSRKRTPQMYPISFMKKSAFKGLSRKELALQGQSVSRVR